MRSILKPFAIAWFALDANCLVSAQKTSRKLIGDVANCDEQYLAAVNESCQYVGTSISCPSGQEKRKEGWCFLGGRTWKCYQRRCRRCSSGYYKADELRCIECSKVGNCKSNSVTCSSSTNSVCSSCEDGFTVEDGKCNVCPPIDNCAAFTCESSPTICETCNLGYFLEDEKCTKCDQTTPICPDGYLTCTNTADSTCLTECGVARQNVTKEHVQDIQIVTKNGLDLSFSGGNANTSNIICPVLASFGSTVGLWFNPLGDFEIGVTGTPDSKMTLEDNCQYTFTDAIEGAFQIKPCGNSSLSASSKSVQKTEKQCQTCGTTVNVSCPYLNAFNELESPFNDQESSAALLGLEGCTTQTKSRSIQFGFEQATELSSGDVLQNIVGFELGWAWGIQFFASYESTVPHPNSAYSKTPCDGMSECSSEESKTVNVGIAVSAGIEASAQLQIVYKGYKLAGIGATGAGSFEVRGDFNAWGDTRVCFEGGATIELRGYVKIFWVKLSVTVVDISFTGYLGKNCFPDYPNRYWYLKPENGIFPGFQLRTRNLQHVNGDDRILRPALTEHGWKPLMGKGKYQFDVMPIRRFNSIWRNSNKILRRKCDDCIPSHQDLYYRRMNKSEDIEEFDLIEIIKEFFNSGEATSHNIFGVDFNLYSTYEDALSNTNSWEYCDVAESDDEIVGFPSNCSPSEDIRADDQWSSITDPSNLAYERPAYSSEGSNTMSLNSIRDGIKVAEDESESYQFEPGSYITIDLEENAKISYILLYFPNVDYNLVIEVLDDDENPTYEISYDREQVYSWPERIELPAEGKRVRIYNKHETLITLVEVEVFGVLNKYSRSAIGGQQNVAFYVEIGATNCILYDLERMAVIVQNNEIMTDDDLMGCDDLEEDDLTWNDEELTCKDANHQCGFITTLSGTKDCGSCPGGSFCGATDDLSGTKCQCTPGVQVCQRTEDGKGQIGFCETGKFEVIEECNGPCTYNELGQPSCAKTCGSTSGSTSALDAIRKESRIDYEHFVSFRTSNNDRITCWFSEYEEDTDYRFVEDETIESCQETCLNDKKCVGIEFIPNRASGRGDCAIWLEGACFSEDSPGRFVCPNARTDTFVRSGAICDQALPCLTMLDASDVDTEGDACDERECWSTKYRFKNCRIVDDCEDDSYCRKLEASPFRICVDKISGEPIYVEPPTELPTETRPTEFPTKTPTSPDKKSTKKTTKKKKIKQKSEF